MKTSSQFTATHTIDLGYEQLLILEGGRAPRVTVLFRGQWLSESIDPQPYARNTDSTP